MVLTVLLAWFIAAFLPLPPRPLSMQKGGSPEIGAAVLGRVAEYETRRYQNARWWRNLNRWMCPLGLAIIVIVVGGRRSTRYHSPLTFLGYLGCCWYNNRLLAFVDRCKSLRCTWSKDQHSTIYDLENVRICPDKSKLVLRGCPCFVQRCQQLILETGSLNAETSAADHYLPKEAASRSMPTWQQFISFSLLEIYIAGHFRPLAGSLKLWPHNCHYHLSDMPLLSYGPFQLCDRY
jgi:hypothetical protein